MDMVPNLYDAFEEDHFKGIPPFRAMVLDYPEDRNTFRLSDEYMIGSGLLAAPLTAGEMKRSVYLPTGVWYDFNSNRRMEGGKTYSIEPAAGELPVFVKAGTILPLARPVEHISADVPFEITCYVYGD